MKYFVENRIGEKQSFLNPVLVILTISWRQFAYSALTNRHAILLFSQLAVKKWNSELIGLRVIPLFSLLTVKKVE